MFSASKTYSYASLNKDLKVSIKNCEDLFQVAIDSILKSIHTMEKSKNSLSNLHEEQITARIAETFTFHELFTAFTEANNNGHADLVLTCPLFSDMDFELIAEAKRDKDIPECASAVTQVLEYVSWHKNAVSLHYFQNPISGIRFQKVVQHIRLKNQVITSGQQYDRYTWTELTKNDGFKIKIYHFMIDCSAVLHAQTKKARERREKKKNMSTFSQETNRNN